MNEDLTPGMQRHAQHLYRYIATLESGDSETILVMLQEAERDPALERLILEVNTMYQLEDGTSITPNEVRDVQQFLHSYSLSDQLVDKAIPVMTTENEQMNGRNFKETLPLPLPQQQKSARERIDRDMKTISSKEAKITPSVLPFENGRNRKRPSTNARLRRLSSFVQMLAAVLVVIVLIAGFLLVGVLHFKMQSSTANTGKLNGTWRLISNPNPGVTDNQLQGVTALSADDAWAVGSYENQFGAKSYTLIEHWNGKQWQVVQSPSPGANSNGLTSVTATGPDDIWAAGAFSNNSSNLDGQALIEHWNGKQWSVIQNPPGSDQVALQAITALSANDIWAVGSKSGGKGTFTEHWNGTKWTVVPSPKTGEPTNSLMAVTALSTNDVWADGFAEGSTTSAGQSQAVQRGLIEHWDGTKWSIVSSPNLNGLQSMLYGMTAVSTNDVWATGVSLNYSAGTTKTLVEHWDGTHWSVMSSPNAGAGNVLGQITAISANNVWAVGYSFATKIDQSNNVSRTLTEHWNGSQWSVVASPNPEPPSINDMIALAGVPGSNKVWAVGSHGQATTLSFIELFS
ncbi:MAG: hypothetical protein ACYDER_22175 [Ktedonobacteraceae bacterium]